MKSSLSLLPPKIELETKEILKKISSANRYLAELKGISGTIPNQDILINTLFLQEAKDSSAIENIITTHDDLFKEGLFPEFVSNAASKEVRNYLRALKLGYSLLSENNLLTNNIIIAIQARLEKTNGFRTLPGTVLKNNQNDVIYTPPQNSEEIIILMNNLEKFINDDEFFSADPLVKMAIIHYQFESIHPFYDGNGRTGRIINILYLAQKHLLQVPVLYLSRYIVQTKNQYYQLLQRTHNDEKALEEWVLYMLEGVETTSRQTIALIHAINKAYLDYQKRIRDNFKFYSLDLINNLFMHPYTKIEFLERDLKISRITAIRYLKALTDAGFLKKEKMGTSSFYINTPLFKILTKSKWEET